MLCYTMLCYTMLCYTMLCYTMLYYTMLCYAMLCYAMLCYAMLYYAMLCYAMLHYAMLHYAMLYYAMLYYAMLCYAMLCYAMLCYAIHVSGALSHQDPQYLANSLHPRVLLLLAVCSNLKGHPLLSTGHNKLVWMFRVIAVPTVNQLGVEVHDQDTLHSSGRRDLHAK